MKFLKKSTQFFRLLEGLSGDHSKSKRMKGVYPGFEEELDGDYVKSEMEGAGESGYKGPSSYQFTQEEAYDVYENFGMAIRLLPTDGILNRNYTQRTMTAIKKLMQEIQDAALVNNLDSKQYNWMSVTEIHILIPRGYGDPRNDADVERFFQDLDKRVKRGVQKANNKNITMEVTYFGPYDDSGNKEFIHYIVD
jgi:hypothetical protein